MEQKQEMIFGQFSLEICHCFQYDQCWAMVDVMAQSPLGCLLMVFIHSRILMNRSWVCLANGLWHACLKRGLIKHLLGERVTEGCKGLHAFQCKCVCALLLEDRDWLHAPRTAVSLPVEAFLVGEMLQCCCCSTNLQVSLRSSPLLSLAWPFSTEAAHGELFQMEVLDSERRVYF